MIATPVDQKSSHPRLVKVQRLVLFALLGGTVALGLPGCSGGGTTDTEEDGENESEEEGEEDYEEEEEDDSDEEGDYEDGERANSSSVSTAYQEKGFVLDGPVRNATITLTDANGSTFTTTTGTNGKYAVGFQSRPAYPMVVTSSGEQIPSPGKP